MFCPHCGKSNMPNSSFCEACGKFINNNQIIKPIISNVGYDDTLPKNSNFVFVLIIIAFLMASILIFLDSYKAKYDYTQSVSYNNYNFYLPIGFKSKIEEVEKSGKFLYIYNSDVSYMFQTDKANYSDYTANNYYLLKNELKNAGNKYSAKDIEEVTYNNKKITLVKVVIDDNEYYFFMYDFSDYDEIISGYIYSKNSVTTKDLNTLYELLSRIK